MEIARDRSGDMRSRVCLQRTRHFWFLIWGSNGIGDDGVKSLARGLTRNETLRELHLDFCNISKLGLSVLTDLMRTNTTVTRLWLHGNCFQDEDMSTVMRYVSRNQDKERLRLARVSGFELSEKEDRRVVRGVRAWCSRKFK